MVALTQDRLTPEREGDDYAFGMAAGATIFAGSLVVLNTAGDAIGGATGVGLIAVGRAQEQITNLGGAGATKVRVRRGFFPWDNSVGADLITRAEIGDDCFIVDDHTVAKTSNGDVRSRAGRVIDVVGGQVFVATGIALDGSPAPVPIDPPAVPTPSISVAVTGSLAEGGTMTITVTASATSAIAMSFDLAVSGTGGNPVNAADFGGAFPSWASVSIAPGSTSVTRTFTAIDDPDFEPDETGRVTISNPVGCTIASATANFTVLNNDGAGGGTLYPEPFVAEFGTVAALGAFYGTSLDSGGVTWQPASGNAEANANFQISTAGILAGPGLTVANNRFAAFDTGARTGNSRRWTTVKASNDLSLLSSSRYSIGVSITNNAAADSQYMSIGLGANPVTATPTALSLSERGAGASTSSIAQATAVSRDVYTIKDEVVASVRKVTLLRNGRAVLEHAGTASPITGLVGFKAGTPVDGVDAVVSFDPDVHAGIIAVSPARTRQRQSDGSLIVRLDLEFSLSAPAEVRYTAFNTATMAPIAGYENLVLGSYVVAGLKATGRTVALPTATVPNIHLEVWRTDTDSGKKSHSWTPTPQAGHVILMAGQSLIALGLEQETGATYAVTGDHWKTEGRAKSSSPLLQQVKRIGTASGAPSGFVSGALAGGIVASMNMLCAARGDTTTIERNPGHASDRWAGTVEIIRDGGNDLGAILDGGGQYEIAVPSSGGYANAAAALADWNAQLLIQQAAVEAIIGHEVPLGLMWLGQVWNATDAENQAARRKQWELAASNPSKIKIICNPIDLQHTTTSDNYHLSGAEFQEQFRRLGHGFAKLMGAAAYDRSGPLMLSAARSSATTITVTFDLNGASALEITGTAYASDFRCGLDFSASDFAIANCLFPTGAAVAGNTVVFTFGAALPASVNVRAMWGLHPIGRGVNIFGRDNAILGAMLANGAAIRGVFSGEPSNPPVQPYFHVSGNDYVVAA